MHNFWEAFWALANSPFVMFLFALVVGAAIALFVGERGTRR